MAKSFDVFVSHSSSDKTVADAIVTALEFNGIRCWIAPRDIEPGEMFEEAIMEGLDGSQIFLLIFSEESYKSPHVFREVACACNAGKTMVPFKITDTKPAGKWVYYLSSPHWLNAVNSPLDINIENLVVVIKRYLGRAVSSTVKQTAEMSPQKKEIASTLDSFTDFPLAAQSNPDDFVIKKGVLTEYKGKGGAVVIPSDVTEIGDFVFNRNKKITAVKLPTGLKTIGNRAFSDCDSLTTITVPQGVEKIDDQAFSYCDELVSIFIPASVTYMGNCVFWESGKLTIYVTGRTEKPKGWDKDWNYCKRPVCWDE